MASVNKATKQDLKSVFSLLKEVNLPLEGVTDNFEKFFCCSERWTTCGLCRD